jgi:hypothetical protein
MDLPGENPGALPIAKQIKSMCHASKVESDVTEIT